MTRPNPFCFSSGEASRTLRFAPHCRISDKPATKAAGRRGKFRDAWSISHKSAGFVATRPVAFARSFDLGAGRLRQNASIWS